MKKVGIYVFDGVEVLDFAGPFEVFSRANFNGEKLFNAFTIGKTREVITTYNNLKLIPEKSFSDNLNLDVLILPGGNGIQKHELQIPNTLEWIKAQSKQVPIVASVCTGALLLGAIGILDNKKATTHHEHLEELKSLSPSVELVENAPFVDQGNVLTSAGIATGIDLSLHIVSRLFGEAAAKQTAKTIAFKYS